MTDLQAEVLLGEFWDPGSGAVFAEEGDQQRFWKLTRKFAENLASISEDGKVRAVSIPPGKYSCLLAHRLHWCRMQENGEDNRKLATFICPCATPLCSFDGGETMPATSGRRQRSGLP